MENRFYKYGLIRAYIKTIESLFTEHDFFANLLEDFVERDLFFRVTDQ
jgi:hypothetical protein